MKHGGKSLVMLACTSPGLRLIVSFYYILFNQGMNVNVRLLAPRLGFSYTS